MRAADADILIIPGLSNSGPDHWQSRWQRRLSTARRIEQQDWDAPQRDAWVETIAGEIAACRRPVICVAHSLGVVALLHAAERCGDRIAGAFLAAPPSESVTRELPAVDGGFLPYPRRRLAFPALLVGSRDDPYAEPEFAARLAADLGARFVDAGAAGHITVASGHGPWPEGSLTFAPFVASL
jgi:predicted alpha/beta hydrolase family esterase